MCVGGGFKIPPSGSLRLEPLPLAGHRGGEPCGGAPVAVGGDGRGVRTDQTASGGEWRRWVVWSADPSVRKREKGSGTFNYWFLLEFCPAPALPPGAHVRAGVWVEISFRFTHCLVPLN